VRLVSADKEARFPGGFARVAVLPPIPGREILSYGIPESLDGRLLPGMRVLVPLGRRQVTGILLGPDERPPVSGVKAILDRLDETPLLSPDLLELCTFAASYYQTTLPEVLTTAVLAGLRAESRRRVRLARDAGAVSSANGLGKTEREVLRRLSSARSMRTSALGRSLPSSAFYEALRSLAADGWIAIEEEAARAPAVIKRERWAVLAREPEGDEQARLEKRARGQHALLALLRAAGGAGVALSELGDRRGPLAALVRTGIARLEAREVYRETIAGDPQASGPFAATPAQAAAIATISTSVENQRFEAFLLQGITGSGKTEVYLQSAARTLELGRSVLFLVPEIALTHDAVDRVCARFGRTVAVLHSGLSAGERFDEWRRLARREARVAVGVRSAVFAPVPELGLVVVDEEHDGAYKQEDGLRYNARDLAIVRARDASCPVVLGSATPSMESRYNAELGRYSRLELRERIEQRPLPAVEAVDLRTEPPIGDPPIFAARFAEALSENLAHGGQSLLFLNRRGFAHYLQCRVCGHVLGCPNCSVALTLHLRERRVRCHHCDYGEPARDLCPQCTSPSLTDFGIGTEQVETAIERFLPAARVRRMDRDTVRRKGAMAELLRDWREARIDVLIGTQMVAKGHDVPGVTFVGVVNADPSLNLPDFRAAERTFQLLTQVAGRAGRGDLPGRVLIQTRRPDHYAIRHALTHDFESFVAEELRYRDALGYPPFRKLAVVRFDGEDAGQVEAAARELAADAKRRNESRDRGRRARILGPAPAPLERLRGRYRWHLLFKAADVRDLREAVQPSIRESAERARHAGVRIAVDVDPYAML
jgi:primosomal protein N' (replication factor Y) (superfamily II helicase)